MLSNSSDEQNVVMVEGMARLVGQLISELSEKEMFLQVLNLDGVSSSEIRSASKTLLAIASSFEKCRNFEESSKLAELRAYCRTVRKGSDREVRDGDEVSGYWQTEDWIDGLLQLCEEGD